MIRPPKIVIAGGFALCAGGLLVLSRQCAHTQAAEPALPPPGHSPHGKGRVRRLDHGRARRPAAHHAG